MAKLKLTELLSRWREDRRFMENVKAIKTLPVDPGTFAPYPGWVHPKIKEVLAASGITRLYSHQSTAIQAAHAGGMWSWGRADRHCGKTPLL
jgi:DEAD/DEAH box helicase domain-containing protein